MGDFNWGSDPGAFIAYLSNDLNALPVNAICTDGAVINNESQNFKTFLDISMKLSSHDVTAQTNPCIDIYLVESDDDGTTFESDGTTDGDTADNDMPPEDKIVAKMAIRISDDENKLMIKSLIPINPGRFKLYPRNKSAVQFTADNNSYLKYRMYNIEG